MIKQKGINLLDDIAASVRQHTIVTFIRSYETTFRSQAEVKVSVIKAYKLDECPTPNLISLQPEKQASQSTSPDVNPSITSITCLPEKESAKELFTPSTKFVLEEISSTIESKSVKRSLPFSDKDLDTEKTKTLLAIKKEVGDQVIKGSPTKKTKDSKDNQKNVNLLAIKKDLGDQVMKRSPTKKTKD